MEVILYSENSCRASGGKIYKKFHDTCMRSKQIKESLSKGPRSQAWWGTAPEARPGGERPQKPGLVGNSTCKLSTEAEDHTPEVSLGYIGRPCL